MTFGVPGAPVRRAAALLAIAALIATPAGAQSARAARAKTSAKQTASTKPAEPIRFVVAPAGNEARYRVREQLMGASLPNDAVGVTNGITGTILAYPDGRIVKDSSRIVVDVRLLKSDKSRRDGFLQRRTLETEKYPTVELVPTEIRGFDGKLPASGPVTFQLVGDLTVHGVTRPTVWNVTARADGQDVAGTATTAFTFKDVDLDQPRVPVVLSVADTIKLEYEFRMKRQ
ncbi:MAG TPA: YceI family protein [Gemmatimonadaceae bacterium]|jgi:polyisoprenoid-binding protein YceI|nr:YceI family protein [Gemmatimonadaceae bacterium]